MSKKSIVIEFYPIHPAPLVKIGKVIDLQKEIRKKIYRQILNRETKY